MFIYDSHDAKLLNTARWQEPAFDKASDLKVIHLWSDSPVKRFSIEPRKR